MEIHDAEQVGNNLTVISIKEELLMDKAVVDNKSPMQPDDLLEWITVALAAVEILLKIVELFR